ncbi:MAG TPA: DUF2314 domain-containing protein [Opitutaceae bacterium]|nr:DUF2314 domain-containing protein [Opitutaceae bacterium]
MHTVQRLIVLYLATLLVSCARDSDKGISVSKDDPEMNAAIARAQETLPTFWAKRDEVRDRFTGLLKVYFTDVGDEDAREHMWVAVTEHRPDETIGTLLSEPIWLESVKGGDTVRFPDMRITDWLFVQDGRAQGAFTIRLLRTRMTPGERKAHDANYPFAFE